MAKHTFRVLLQIRRWRLQLGRGEEPGWPHVVEQPGGIGGPIFMSRLVQTTELVRAKIKIKVRKFRNKKKKKGKR